jgi:hypothetical protein
MIYETGVCVGIKTKMKPLDLFKLLSKRFSTTSISQNQKNWAANRIKGFEGNIWSILTPLAQKHGAVNLGQGFPNFEPPAFLIDVRFHAYLFLIIHFYCYYVFFGVILFYYLFIISLFFLFFILLFYYFLFYFFYFQKRRRNEH